MATNPPLHLLNPKRSKERVRDRASLALPLLQEAVHYGLAAFRRCAYVLRHEDEEYNRAIFMPYLHLIEMLDVVRIFLAQVASASCAIQMRSMFVELLMIE